MENVPIDYRYALARTLEISCLPLEVFSDLAWLLDRKAVCYTTTNASLLLSLSIIHTVFCILLDGKCISPLHSNALHCTLHEVSDISCHAKMDKGVRREFERSKCADGWSHTPVNIAYSMNELNQLGKVMPCHPTNKANMTVDEPLSKWTYFPEKLNCRDLQSLSRVEIPMMTFCNHCWMAWVWTFEASSRTARRGLRFRVGITCLAVCAKHTSPVASSGLGWPAVW